MLTALVQAHSTPGALAATLSALVPAVAEGLISHAVVMLPSASPDSERIADAMGATIIRTTDDSTRDQHWRDAAQMARGDWVLLLEAGETPGHGWISCIEQHLMMQTSASSRAAILPLAGGASRLIERIRLLFGARHLTSGMVAPRRQITSGLPLGKLVLLAVPRHQLPS